MNKHKGLGRGLDALLGSDETERKDALGTLAVSAIRPGKYQPRTKMDPAALNELAASIRAKGLMQPVLVRPLDRGSFELIAGERRWRAAQMAGLTEIPALVREVPDDTALAMSLIENIQREDLNPMEEAAGVQRLVDEFSMTHDQAADAIGRSRSATTNLLRLLKLAKPVQQMLLQGALEMGHARALLSLEGRRQQSEVGALVAKKKLSVRDTEALVKRLVAGKEGRQESAAPRVDPNIRKLENELTEKLGARVQVQHSSAGKGKLVISYHTLDELDGILEHIH